MFDPSFIKNNFQKLTKQEQVVADYALKKEFELINMSIKQVVSDTKTSLATVNRAFAKMGYTGYKYYKMFLFANLKINPRTNEESDFQRSHLLLSIENTYSSLNYELMDKIANMIIKNKKGITFLCEGFSYFIAKIFASKLAKLGFDSKFFDDSLYTGALSTNLVIIISATMSNQSLYQKIKIIRKTNPKAEFVIITTNAGIKGKYDYDEVIIGSYIDNFRMNAKELPSDSLVLLLISCNYLFDRLYLKNKVAYDEQIEKIKW